MSETGQMSFDEVADLWGKAALEVDAQRKHIATLEARVKELEGELAEVNETLFEIRNWANAYPKKIFTEPSKKELDEITEKIGANAMTRLHGTWGRHITDGIRAILAKHKPTN